MWKGLWPTKKSIWLRWEQFTHHGPRLKPELQVGNLEMLKVPPPDAVTLTLQPLPGDRKVQSRGHTQSFQRWLRERQCGTNTPSLGTLSESAWPWVHHGTSGPIRHLWKENRTLFPRLLLILKVNGSMFYFKLPCSSRSFVSYLYDFILAIICLP